MKTILFSFIFCLIYVCLSAQPGTLDSSFGVNGFVAGKLPGLVNTIIQQEDGKLLAAGSFDLKYSIARFLNNGGTIDSSFGIDGYAVSNPVGSAYDMLLTADKKILISGSYVDENNIEQYFVSRFTANGKPDDSFGVMGTSVIPKAHRADVYTQIALNEDGSIIAGGFGTNSVITLDSQYTMVSKLSANGVFENTFGNNGYVLNLTSLNMKDLAIQADGKIVTAGYNMGFDFVFSRYNIDGSLDKSFGNNGNETFFIGGDDEPQKILLQPDGKLMIGGFTSLNGSKMCALRLNYNGSLDETFGDSGKVVIYFQNSDSWAYDIVQQPDGKFILTGGASDPKQTKVSFALCRITKDGKLDSSFGTNGLQRTIYSNFSQANCAALQIDGKIVLGGIYQKKNYTSYLMVRYFNDESKKQIIIKKIKHYISTHNNANAEALNNNITLYPNPVQNILTIKGLSSINNYELIINNAKGSVLATKQVSNIASYQFHVQNLSSGVYYVNVVANNKLISTLKFVKQ